MRPPQLRRVWRTGVSTVVIVTLAIGLPACGRDPGHRNAQYCAVMPDAIGLYAGNPVTQMGYQIGTVTSVTPETQDARVNFAVNEPRRLPVDVKAIIRSSSILADRSLELVGDYDSGPQLPVGGCIPLTRSSTPKSLSQVIGSATNFVNALNPQSSSNIGDVVHELDQALHHNGAGVNQLLTTSSALLNNPDQAISDIGSIVTNLAQLTSLLTELRGPLKEILLDAEQTTPDFATALVGGEKVNDALQPVVRVVSDLENELGAETQFTLDSTGFALRKLSAHAQRLSNLLNVLPPWINWASNVINGHRWNTITYRPPLYRIRLPNGVLTCNMMNASLPGSCANVEGQPYAVDVALLEYVLTQAARR